MHLYKRVTREERINPNDFQCQRSRSFEVNQEIHCVHDLERAVSQINYETLCTCFLWKEDRKTPNYC